ncbi:unnamed protein product [Ceratitis capitata]|uniref:(Mediterranean fruit fly) hypothetical protein n=1 Tax=Ceratitis capitata TaxID=7213 RepID=A0A811UXU9_CERCA|nr:unnamed protein product [Ceratitis capitata]
MVKILQWNLNGYWNNLQELQLLMRECNPEVVALQETHIPHNTIPYIPQRYVGYFHNICTNNSSKQGVCLMIKKEIPHKRLDTRSNISAIAVEMNIGFKITVISLYIPPSQNFTSTDILSTLNNISTPLILMGDFNSWSSLWGSTTGNSRGKAVEDALLASNLIILNDGSPTHFSTHQTFTNVDISFCSASIAPKCSWEIYKDLWGSDHFPIITSIDTEFEKDRHKFHPKFITDKADWVRFQYCCDSLSQKNPISQNINQEAATIKKILRTASHYNIPQTKKRTNKPSVPWWSNNLSSLRLKKQRAWANYKHQQTEINLINYKKANAEFRYQLKLAKRNCFNQLTSSINPNSSPREIWQNIRLFTGNFKKSYIKVIDSEQGCLDSKEKISKFFASTWSNYSRDSNFGQSFISEKNKITSLEYDPGFLSNAAREIENPITIFELEQVLLSVKGKTPSHDRISYPIIKNVSIEVKIRILELFNKIFERGVYPQNWRNADIVPILKPNKPQDNIKSYRPISLLPCISKVLEKILARRLMWFALKEKHISPNQVAFKQGQGTADILLHLEHFVTTAISNRNHITILALDFEKAFDRIGIHVVLRQLKKWNVGKKLFNIVKSILSFRTFRVKVNNAYSDRVSLFNGIAQGSPISVIFFIIAFEEINNILKKYKIEHSIYADDVLIFSKNNNLIEIKSLFTNILDDLSVWALSSGANISYTKCNTLHICKKTSCTDFNFTYKNNVIQNVTKLKILGIIFDKTLLFKEHCKYIKNKITNRLSILKYLASKHSNVHQTTLVNIMRSLILSIIDYGLPIYGYCSKSTLAILSAPYHASVRISLRAFPTTPIQNLLAEAGLPDIENRTYQNTIRLIPKLFTSNNPILHNDVKNCLKRTRKPKRPSSIFRVVQSVKELNIPIKPIPTPTSKFPPWYVPTSGLISTLLCYSKGNTAPIIYQKMFLEIQNQWKIQGWSLIFTDGSKDNLTTSFAVVKENGHIIKTGILLPHCSVFTAEAFAISLATEFAAANKGKYIICTDSKASFSAVQNFQNQEPLICKIRTKLQQHINKIKIMWIPGHCGIAGNEYADKAAKNASHVPCLTFQPTLKADMLKLINSAAKRRTDDKWVSYLHPYKTINPTRSKPYPPNLLPSKK